MFIKVDPLNDIWYELAIDITIVSSLHVSSVYPAIYQECDVSLKREN